jgi:hypothetical protein
MLLYRMLTATLHHPTHPAAHAALYLKGFKRLLQEGRVIRERAIAVMYVDVVLDAAVYAIAPMGRSTH